MSPHMILSNTDWKLLERSIILLCNFTCATRNNCNKRQLENCYFISRKKNNCIYLIKAIIKRNNDTNVSPPPKTTASINESKSTQLVQNILNWCFINLGLINYSLEALWYSCLSTVMISRSLDSRTETWSRSIQIIWSLTIIVFVSLLLFRIETLATPCIAPLLPTLLHDVSAPYQQTVI